MQGIVGWVIGSDDGEVLAWANPGRTPPLTGWFAPATEWEPDDNVRLYKVA